MTAKYNFIIHKKTLFNIALSLVDSSGNYISLIGKEVKMVIKESFNTDTILFELTETNGGIKVIDDSKGQIELYLEADDLDIKPSNGVHNIFKIDSSEPTKLIEKIMEGKITFIESL